MTIGALACAPGKHLNKTPIEQAVSVDRIRPAKYTVDGGAMGMREVFRLVFLPPRQWA
jgi:hypothetical protein